MDSSDQQVFVIVGASLAGAKAAETLRAEGFTGRVVLIGSETERPYERPPLSKGYLQGAEPRDKIYVHDPDWYAEQQVELWLGRTVTGIDPAEHAVVVDGTERLHYDKLLLATGSRARRLDVPGAEAQGVLSLRSAEESDALLAALKTGGEVLIVGAGWIGLEVAAAARSHGCNVTVVELDWAPLRRVLGDEIGKIIRDLHEANGVAFRFGIGVRSLGDLDGHVRSVLLDDGTEIAADVVVVGVGIQPAAELALAAGLAVDNGIVVDASLRTADPDIYACGDVASSFRPSIDRHLRVEHWSNALDGGPAAARSMLGQDVAYDPVPYFFTDQFNLGMEYAGFADRDDRLVFRGEPSIEEGFIAFWVSGTGRVTAGMNVNVWDVTDDIQALVRAGWAGNCVDLEKLADPAVPLRDLLP
ncbi:3-phenylpropionate/trans-cinnamate dioxygenase ferredoxin reductase subunit [Allocatelliglobosispora scoriae]|uniref:3-phenylpropionate/trans-cinnamate dioxygenase ferredoxin reductase subunit n=1 Tax=Allocatelliglobosispora scoriae TaxID=643052 RepID=A0A841BYJ7_9ACTN|nr:FAD-dependent oxidoreductase [Allocatelliglobosispora scoriae]MBB5872558.1 3-phenylpropionate/trans-cinnamate dioxygenase ferredoxin reductase subunit [Allocatelliglobosispora scoriae]